MCVADEWVFQQILSTFYHLIYFLKIFFQLELWRSIKKLLEYNCFTMFFLSKSIGQMYTYIHSLGTLSHPSPIPPLQVITEHQAELLVLRSSSLLTILHMVVYICQCYLPSSSHLSFPVSACPFSISASLFLPCKLLHHYHFSIYIYIYNMIFVFLINFLHSV